MKTNQPVEPVKLIALDVFGTTIRRMGKFTLPYANGVITVQGADEYLFTHFFGPKSDKSKQIERRVAAYRCVTETMTFDEMMQAFGTHIPDDEKEAIMQSVNYTFLQEKNITFRRAHELNAFMQEARERHMGVALVSNLGTPYVDVVDALLPDVQKEFRIMSCEVGSRKPEQVIFNTLAQRTGVPLNRSVMIGDNHMNDVAGARTAGFCDAFWLNADMTSTNPDRIGKLTDVFQKLEEKGLLPQ